MTFSILVQDAQTNAIAGAAATGSLCVGGWVLRGRWGAGMSASQGAAPSTMWGEQVLHEMAGGKGAAAAVEAVTGPDEGRDWRQLSALDMGGAGACFSGKRNTALVASHVFDCGVAAGNMLGSAELPEAMAQAYLKALGSLPERLMAALWAAAKGGSDKRGLLSAALLVLRPDAAPLTLRVDYSEQPLEALGALLERATSGDYGDWARQVPTLEAPERVLDEALTGTLVPEPEE
ncbi:DUF1028 domain-containing protein [Vannielia litorea]|uniref:DUF1028 domain-containing protein n=1 Tax=Vannielia litorea TaxID=1217970 RepID=UPI001C985772|nr:DUF1028 domain-containing protein [Vannielia litorea]MBY6049362.1 DUF1028 domain-containing protein [Vannielia litorea]MBY6076776.1 DUF1028 domain-containing protein [Vannielia litorea]